MSLQSKIGQLFICGFKGLDPRDPGLKFLFENIEEGLIGGLIFFGYNIQEKNQLQDLIGTIKALKAPLPLFLSVDQEGGKVQRLSSKNGFQGGLSALAVAEKFSPEEAYQYYQEQAAVLQEVGLNLTFAPVVDLHSDQSPVIGAYGRSFGTEPETVVAYGRSFIKAHQDKGILTCLKHFPGHGLALADSHAGLVDITETWQERELEPYKALIQENLTDFVMTGHLWHREWHKDLPAAFQREKITALLKQELKFKGLVITDDLAMGAIQQNYTLNDALILSLTSGHDLLLYSFNQAASPEAKTLVESRDSRRYLNNLVLEAVQSGRLSEEQINSSYDRILETKKKISV